MEYIGNKHSLKFLFPLFSLGCDKMSFNVSFDLAFIFDCHCCECFAINVPSLFIDIFVALHLPNLEKNCSSLPWESTFFWYLFLYVLIEFVFKSSCGWWVRFQFLHSFCFTHNLFICMWQRLYPPFVKCCIWVTKLNIPTPIKSFTCRIYKKKFRSLLLLLLLVHCV
jgi:hypothetical protein